MKRISFLCFCFVGISASAASALNLNAWRDRVKANNSDFRAIDLRMKSEKERIAEEGDMVLSPLLDVEYSQYDDKKPPMIPQFQGNETSGKDLTLAVAKNFSTGTQSRVFWTSDYTQIFGIPNITIDPTWVQSLGFEVTQSLWKDMLGRKTRLRHHRENSELDLSMASINAETQKLWADAEDTYWTWVQKSAEKTVVTENLERARSLLVWAKRQYGRRLSNESDLLQTEALVAGKELQLAMAQDELLKSIEQMKTFDPQFKPEDFSAPGEDAWRVEAKDRMSGTRTRIDSYISKLSATMAEGRASEASEDLRPDLKLTGRYATNDRNATFGGATPNFDSTKNTVYLGLSFTMNLDFGAVKAMREVATQSAEAARIKADKATADGRMDWNDLLRTYADLKSRSQIAEKLFTLQQDMAKKERKLLEKGRSSTFQVIQFEQQQAEAQLTWIKTLIGLRKMEAQAQLFVEDKS